ncbi:MAG: ATPase domain-containing protein, partial [Thermaurantiacus sp.]
SEATERSPDEDLQFLADGLINLALSPVDGRTLVVTKFRGSSFRSGQHSMAITGTGAQVFPKLIPANFRTAFKTEKLSFGVEGLDDLLVGGLERGTVTILTGPSGAGKTTLGLRFVVEAVSRGERAVAYTFSEEPEIMLQRAEALAIPARRMVESKAMGLVKVEPLRFSPDEFAAMVRHEVEVEKTRVILLDSVAGYRLSLRGADLISHLHALTTYLQNMGVVVVMINELETVSGEFRATEVGASYLADNILFMRYIELHNDGEVELRKGIGVLKKRLTDFDRRMREISFHDDGIRVSAPLSGISSILGVLPTWNGKYSQKPRES